MSEIAIYEKEPHPKQIEKLAEDCAMMGHGLDLLSFERFVDNSFYQTERFQAALIRNSVGQ